MTIEEIRKEAEAIGYSITFSKKPPNLLPCVCGCKRRRHWHSKDGLYLQCGTCYLKSKPGKTAYDVNTNWNNMILEKRGNLDGGYKE